MRLPTRMQLAPWLVGAAYGWAVLTHWRAPLTLEVVAGAYLLGLALGLFASGIGLVVASQLVGRPLWRHAYERVTTRGDAVLTYEDPRADVVLAVLYGAQAGAALVLGFLGAAAP